MRWNRFLKPPVVLYFGYLTVGIWYLAWFGNRRRVPEWELGLGAEAYEDDSSVPRFSQGEVDAKIRER